jgi:hypothetical protein
VPTWGAILHEVKETLQPGGGPDFDGVRRKYLRLLARHTGRNVISYATAWTSAAGSGPAASINPEDVQAFMEVVHGLTGDSLDLILHSPGGSPETTEAIVNYLRQKFTSIRVLIPQAAMSAATMLACAADQIVMGKHSSIGPIDPQMIIRSEGQVIQAPAAAIKAQFAEAQAEVQKDPSKLPSWIPILRQFGPALLAQCRFAEQLSESLVKEWLKLYMFKGQADAEQRGSDIAAKLVDHGEFKTHGRFISRVQARAFGLSILDLEADQQLQDFVLSSFHAATITFSATAAVKIVENHLGKAFVKQERQITVQQVFHPPAPAQPNLAPPGGPGASVPLYSRKAKPNRPKKKRKKRR